MNKHLTLLLSSLLASGAVFAQSQQAIRDQIFGETDAVKKQADELEAKTLSPEAYADTMEKGRDLERVRRDLAEAKGFFEHSIEASKLAQTTFTEALAARAAAKTAAAELYAARDWERAEKALTDAAATLEGGNLNKAIKDAGDAQERYRETETHAIAGRTRATN